MAAASQSAAHPGSARPSAPRTQAHSPPRRASLEGPAKLTARAATAGKREASPEVLAKRVKELEVQQQEELKAKAKEAKRRQKELADAKKRIAKELQSATKVVKKGEQEVTKLSSLVGKVEDQTDKARQQQTKQLEQLDASIKKMREKRSSLESALHEKVAQVGEAKGKMAHMEFAAKMIESGVIVPTDGSFVDPEQLGSRGTMQRSGSMPHIGSGGARLDSTLLALQEENEHLRILLEEAHRKLSACTCDALEDGRRGGSPRLGSAGSPKLGSLGSASTGALHRAASSIKDDLNPLHTNRSSLRSAQHSASASTPPMDAPVASHTSSRGVSAPPGYAASAGPVPSHHSLLSEPRPVRSQQSQSASVPSHHSEPRPVLSQPHSVLSHPMPSTAVASHQSSAAGSAPGDSARRGLLSGSTPALTLGAAQQPMQGPLPHPPPQQQQQQHQQQQQQLVHMPAGAHQAAVEYTSAIRLASGIRVVPDANGAGMHPAMIRTAVGGPVHSGPPAVQYVLRPTSPVSPGMAFRRGVPTEPTALAPQPTLLNGMQQAATPEVKPMPQQAGPQPQHLGAPAWQPSHLAYMVPQGPRTA